MKRHNLAGIATQVDIYGYGDCVAYGTRSSRYRRNVFNGRIELSSSSSNSSDNFSPSQGTPISFDTLSGFKFLS